MMSLYHRIIVNTSPLSKNMLVHALCILFFQLYFYILMMLIIKLRLNNNFSNYNFLFKEAKHYVQVVMLNLYIMQFEIQVFNNR